MTARKILELDRVLTRRTGCKQFTNMQAGALLAMEAEVDDEDSIGGAIT